MNRHRSTRIVIVLLALLISAPFALAQDGGQPVTLTGMLSPFEPASDVLVRVRQNLPLTVTLSASTLDPTLTLLDSLGQVVLFNDDHEGGVNLPSQRDAALAYTPAADDLMVIRLASLNWASGGAYTLTLEGAEVVAQDAVNILENASGQVVEGVLEQQADRAPRKAYAFPARAGTDVMLTLASSAFDAVLDVYEFRGELLATNDDHDPERYTLAQRTDAALTFTAPEDSLYIALVRVFEDSGAGRFTLAIEGAVFGTPPESRADETPPAGTCDGVLGGVVAVSSTFTRDYAAENLLDGDGTTGWSSREDDDAPYLIFEVSSGATVLLDGVVFNGFAASPGFVADSVRGFEVGVSTTLVEPDAFAVVLSGEVPQQHALQTFTFAPVPARYVLLRLQTNYGGDHFQATAFDACTTLTGQARGSLSGEPPFVVSGQLRPDEDFVEYRLYARENATLTITLTSEVFDPVLEVYGENGQRLADNDDHAPEVLLPRLWDSALTASPPDAGMLSVRVRSLSGGGPFVLTIDGVNIQAQPPDVPSLPACNDVSSASVGGAVVGFSSEFGGRWLAAYINDGSPETGWASAPGPASARAEYVVLDLVGGVRAVEGIRINPSATGGDSTAHNVSRFAVLVSTTSAEPDAFEEVYSTLIGERARHTLAYVFPERVEARYVMLETRDTFGGRWHEVAEFTVCAF